MAQTAKLLGQASPAADTPADLYTAPADTTAVVSALFVCNTGTADTVFSVSVADGGAAEGDAQWLYRDHPVPAKRTFLVDGKVVLQAADVLRVESLSGGVAFNLFGLEVT